MSRLRLLYCTSDFSGGGTQRYLLSLVRGLDRQRFEPTVACLSLEGELRRAMESASVPIEHFPITRPLWHPRSLATILALSRRIRGRFDLVHTLIGHANVVGLLACRLAGQRRALASQRSLHPVSGSFRSAGPGLVALGDWLFRHVARRIVVNNQTIAAALRQQGIAEEKIVLIPNGVDTARFRPAVDRRAMRLSLGVDPDADVIGFVGRLIPDKGLGRLLAAAEALLPRCPNLRILAVGDGPARSELEREAHARLADRVAFLGFREDTERVYPALDALAFPSTYSEGTPNVVLEAMACEVPVVAARVGGLPELVQDGVTGFLHPIDDLPAMAESAIRLLSDDRLHAQVAQAARARAVGQFADTKIVPMYEAFYDEVLSR